jgi:hypothetical protein
MVTTVLWAELWSVVARCNLAGNVGILQQNYFDKLDKYLGFSLRDILLAYCVFYGTQIKTIPSVCEGKTFAHRPMRICVCNLFSKK